MDITLSLSWGEKDKLMEMSGAMQRKEMGFENNETNTAISSRYPPHQHFAHCRQQNWLDKTYQGAMNNFSKDGNHWWKMEPEIRFETSTIQENILVKITDLDCTFDQRKEQLRQ